MFKISEREGDEIGGGGQWRDCPVDSEPKLIHEGIFIQIGDGTVLKNKGMF